MRLIGVTAGTYAFDFRMILTNVLEQWPGTRYIPDEDRADFTSGRLEIRRDANPGYELSVDVLAGGRCLALDVASPDLAVELIANLTMTPGFPDDGSVVVAGWDDYVAPLWCNMTWDEVVDATALRY